MVWSLCMTPFLSRPSLWHMLLFPDTQCLQLMHSPMKTVSAWSPAWNSVTPSPTLSTTPDASWPKILGNRSGCAVDCHWVTSLRQMEVETTLTRISMGPGGATSTSSITSACPGPHATAARQVMAAGGEEDDAAAAIAGDLPAPLLPVRILVETSQTIIPPSFRFSRGGGLGRGAPAATNHRCSMQCCCPPTL